jgi:hypothetical protein
MAVQVSYPGVYIEEFAPAPPIEGVGTATAAFLGPTERGPLNEPTKLTSLDTFLGTFGVKPLNGFYLWYAVRGFFENGGQVCYVVRVTNAAPDSLVLKDRSSGGGKDTIRLAARTPGQNSGLKVTVATAHAVNTNLFHPTASIVSASARTIKVSAAADAAKFRAGDVVVVDGTTDKATVQSTDGDLIRLNSDLSGSYGTADNKKLRLASLEPQGKTFRVEQGNKLASGSVIKLSQATTPATEETRTVDRVDPEAIAPGLTTYRVTLRDGLAKAYDLAAAAPVVKIESQEFTLVVTRAGTTATYAELAMDPGHPRSFATVINNDPSGLILAQTVEPLNTTLPPGNLPADVATATALSGGADDNPNALTAADYKRALKTLEAVDDVNMLVIPDRSADLQVQLDMIDHCERMQERFAILDSKRGAPLFGTDGVEGQRAALQSPHGYAALYYPWLVVPSVTGADRVLVPPGGHIAGVFARTDASRGVHKAPAGTDAIVRGTLGVERLMRDVDQGQLNDKGINAIRVFPAGGRPTVWGARTIASDTNWRYVNVRRLFLFLEESIQEGIQWAVFEPNITPLWETLKRSIRAFLLQQWRDGALFGATAEQAFYVRIDEALNPESERKLGRLTIEVGLRPAYPAEFIIVRIGIREDGAEITEG